MTEPRIEIVTPCAAHGRYDIHEMAWPDYCTPRRLVYTREEAIELFLATETDEYAWAHRLVDALLGVGE